MTKIGGYIDPSILKKLGELGASPDKFASTHFMFEVGVYQEYPCIKQECTGNMKWIAEKSEVY